MEFLNPNYPLSDLTRDVIAGFYRSYNALGFGFLESVYKRALALELQRAGLTVQREVAFQLFHLGQPIGHYYADLVVQSILIVEVKTGPSFPREAVPQALNYLNVTKLPLGLVLFFGSNPRVKRVIRNSNR